MRRPYSLAFPLLLLPCVGGAFACRHEKREPPAPAASAPVATGAITGHVKYKGKLEPHQKVERAEDPFCIKVGVEEPEVTRIGKEDALLDSVVHLELVTPSGVSKGDPSLAPRAVVRQRGCAYVPYAIGVLAGADVEFVNEDKTLHNIHAVAVNDPKSVDQVDVLNFALASGEPPRVVQAPKQPGIVRLKCDVHKWMRGWLVVSDHPFFSSTSLEGSFTLSKVPVGKHAIEAFHPMHGSKRATVEVKESDTAVVDFTFTDADKSP